MRRHYVQSSAIRSVGFNPENKVLEVEFVSGTIYRYSGVPEFVYREFMASPSKGRFFDYLIRDRFPTKQIH
jgi:hypothetical protein